MSIQSQLLQARSALDRAFGVKAHIQGELVEWEQSRKECHESREQIDQARIILQFVAKETQKQLQYRISEIVTLALQTIFDDPYEFKVEFVERRGQTECEFFLVRGDIAAHPLSATGGGVVDVVALFLRITVFILSTNPNKRKVFILDEPLKFLSSDLHPRAKIALEEISQRLGIQLIVTTHCQDLIPDSAKIVGISRFSG